MAILSDCSALPRPKGPPPASFASLSKRPSRILIRSRFCHKKKPAFADFFKWRSCRIARLCLVLKDRLRRLSLRSPNALRAFLSAPDSATKKSQLSLTFLNGDPGAIRTPDPQLRRLLLYPAELQDHIDKVYYQMITPLVKKKEHILCFILLFIIQSVSKTQNPFSFFSITLSIRLMQNKGIIQYKWLFRT